MEDQSERAPSDFLNLADLGKNEWWRYLLSIFIVLTLWQLIGSIPYAILLVTGVTVNVFMNYLGISFSFVAFFLSILLVIKFVHRRPVISLVTPGKRYSCIAILTGFIGWFLLSCISSLIDAAIHPGSYRFTWNWPGWLWFTMMAIPFTTIQTSAEELFFRGYILQGFHRSIKTRWILYVLSGIVFAIPHFLNPEMEINFGLLALYYFSFGFFLAWITIRSNSLEYALGIHAANNLFAVIVANYDGSALPSLSIFTASAIDPLFNLVSFVVMAGILGWTLLVIIRNPDSIRGTVDGPIGD